MPATHAAVQNVAVYLDIGFKIATWPQHPSTFRSSLEDPAISFSNLEMALEIFFVFKVTRLLLSYQRAV